jgi:hypothetical protein
VRCRRVRWRGDGRRRVHASDHDRHDDTDHDSDDDDVPGLHTGHANRADHDDDRGADDDGRADTGHASRADHYGRGIVHDHDYVHVRRADYDNLVAALDNFYDGVVYSGDDVYRAARALIVHHDVDAAIVDHFKHVDEHVGADAADTDDLYSG